MPQTAEQVQFRDGLNFCRGIEDPRTISREQRVALYTLGIGMLGLLRFQDLNDIEHDVPLERVQLEYLQDLSSRNVFEKSQLRTQKPGRRGLSEEYLNDFGLYTLTPFNYSEIAAINYLSREGVATVRVKRTARELWSNAPEDVRQKYSDNPFEELLHKRDPIIGPAVRRIQQGNEISQVLAGFSHYDSYRVRKRLREAGFEALAEKTYTRRFVELARSIRDEEEPVKRMALLTRVNRKFIEWDRKHPPQCLVIVGSIVDKSHTQLAKDILKGQGVPVDTVTWKTKKRKSPSTITFITAQDEELARSVLSQDPRTSHLIQPFSVN